MVLETIITQHAEEAAFLWMQRDVAATAPHIVLVDLGRLDTRLEGHIDGLRIADDTGWDICREALSYKEAGEVFTAAILAFEAAGEAHIRFVLDVGGSSSELSRGLVSALGWLPFEQASPHIGTLLGLQHANLRRIGLAASVAHRRDPGDALVRALSDEDLLLRAQALRGAGELGRSDLLPEVRREIMAEDEGCRFAAAWSVALFGDTAAVATLKSFASCPSFGEKAAGLALRRMDLPSAHAWQRELAQNSDSARLAVIGAGVIGDPASVPWLFEQMRIPDLARVAGEAFTVITGVDIAYEDLEGEWPEGFEAGPTENPEDEDVEMDPDENLPWPNPELIQAWWGKNNGRFRSGTRYLCGQPISYEHLQQVLRTGFQRQRAAAAIELAMMKPGQPLFEVRAPGFRQQQMLGLTRTGR
jgi:uncharacterized protein (TIGR02270 family)